MLPEALSADFLHRNCLEILLKICKKTPVLESTKTADSRNLRYS